MVIITVAWTTKEDTIPVTVHQSESQTDFVTLTDLFCQVEEVKKMKIGDPLDRSTDHGPQNHKAHMDKLVEYCQTGVKEGATLVLGGKQLQRPGTTVLPALITEREIQLSGIG